MSVTLTSAGVGVAAGALIAFSFTMSPPLTLVPPRPSDANGNPSMHRNTEVVGASTDEFDGRWQVAIEDIPPMPTSRHVDLEGLNYLPPMAMLPSQVARADPQDYSAFASEQKQEAHDF